jgi:uncharacterized protein (TIGR03085 family)
VPALDAIERDQLCDLFLELGPDAPTCCEGWDTFDLAAHLVVRERDPRAMPGILLGGRFEAGLDRLMEKAQERGYQALVAKVRSGPPLGPMAVPGLRVLLNLNEYFVHHEDVRRANGRGPRTDRPDLDDALWTMTRRGAALQLRKVRGAGVELVRPGHPPVVAKRGTPVARLIGEPGEIVLFLNGRRGVAEIERSGDPSAIAILEAADLGI